MVDVSEVIIVAAVTFFASYLGAYTRRKGENRSMKEDIAQITRNTEEVKSEFRKLRDQSTQRHQLRLAALDKRLAAHQAAYVRWRDLLKAPKDDVLLDCEEWWWQNCLYLSEEASLAFRKALAAAWHRSEILRQPHNGNALMENRKLIEAAGEVIARAVDLPSIGQIEPEETPR